MKQMSVDVVVTSPMLEKREGQKYVEAEEEEEERR